ncbi:MAG: hypothetical protein IJS96_10085 [Schwartzia sp.]|nr:hypothetical protein [Schwartzia sp. (in: firmicutes)]
MAMMKTFNVKHPSRLCAFCRYWYDPANAAIRPKSVVGGFWEYDDTVWNICQRTGQKMRSGMSCKGYQCKV